MFFKLDMDNRTSHSARASINKELNRCQGLHSLAYSFDQAVLHHREWDGVTLKGYMGRGLHGQGGGGGVVCLGVS